MYVFCRKNTKFIAHFSRLSQLLFSTQIHYSPISTFTCLEALIIHLSPSTSKLSPINYCHQNLNTISTLSLISQRYITVLSITFPYISWLYSFDSSISTFKTSVLERLILFCVLKTSILLTSININIASKIVGCW
jgi:hypothetical protein